MNIFSHIVGWFAVIIVTFSLKDIYNIQVGKENENKKIVKYMELLITVYLIPVITTFLGASSSITLTDYIVGVISLAAALGVLWCLVCLEE